MLVCVCDVDSTAVKLRENKCLHDWTNQLANVWGFNSENVQSDVDFTAIAAAFRFQYLIVTLFSSLIFIIVYGSPHCHISTTYIDSNRCPKRQIKIVQWIKLLRVFYIKVINIANVGCQVGNFKHLPSNSLTSWTAR